jgi:hypothetical protein
MSARLRISESAYFMAVLSFLVVTLLQYDFVSTTAHEDAAFGWLRFHRDGAQWTFAGIRIGVLLIDLILAIGLTWLLSKILRRRMA